MTNNKQSNDSRTAVESKSNRSCNYSIDVHGKQMRQSNMYGESGVSRAATQRPPDPTYARTVILTYRPTKFGVVRRVGSGGGHVCLFH